MSKAHQFLQKHMKELATKNYNNIEITFGNKISDYIFDSRISYGQYNLLKKYFQKTCEYTIQYIENKIYFDSNKELYINKTYQQRVYKNKLYDSLIIKGNKKEPFDFNYTFYEKKMISIENFPTRYEYKNEYLKKTTSINIKNKFYLNFNEIEQKNKNCYYTISCLIKRKTNNKFNELHNLIMTYLEQIQKIIQLQI